MKQLNESVVAKCYAGQRWHLLYDQAKYRLHHPDDSPFECSYEKIGPSFPHEVASQDDAQYYKQILCTPYGNEMTMRVAELLLDNERLGEDDVTDNLCLGLSSNENISHNFGPHSLEVEDATYQTDVLLGQFLKTLDERVGPGRWVLALSADHGVTPICEYAKSIGLPAQRNPLGDLKELTAKIEAALVARFGALR